MVTPALYRTRITHGRQAPVRHYFEHRSYSWYIDIDQPPRLPRWLQAFARFDARDHLEGDPKDSLRQRVDAYLGTQNIDLYGGTVTALFQARVLGYVFNPLSLFWCHDQRGTLRCVIAEVHNTYGERHAYLLAPDTSAPVTKQMYVSPFNGTEGHYRVRAPLPESQLNVSISLHRDDHPTFAATVHGNLRRVTVAEVLRLQFVAPLAPLSGAVAIRMHGIYLWLRRVPLTPRPRVNSEGARANEHRYQ